ncbi:hypothetical protein KBT16_30020 [Nostoc sp. CCCryo 231-06]|nr:hypothetical protein [Nostoc sp. CCCryo 231-06]
MDIVFTRTCNIEPARHGILAVGGHFEFRRFWGWGWQEGLIGDFCLFKHRVDIPNHSVYYPDIVIHPDLGIYPEILAMETQIYIYQIFLMAQIHVNKDSSGEKQ